VPSRNCPRPRSRTGAAGNQGSDQTLVPLDVYDLPAGTMVSDYERTLDAWSEGACGAWSSARWFSTRMYPVSIFTYTRRGVQFRRSGPNPQSIASMGRSTQRGAARSQKRCNCAAWLKTQRREDGTSCFSGLGIVDRARSFEQDPFGSLSLVAGIEDTMRAFPQAKGVVIRRSWRAPLRTRLSPRRRAVSSCAKSEKPLLQYLGKDVSRIERGITYIRDRMHRLTPAMVRYYPPEA